MLANAPFGMSQAMTLSSSSSVTVSTGGNAVTLAGAPYRFARNERGGAGILTLAASNGGYTGPVAVSANTVLTLNNAYALPNSMLNHRRQ